MPYVDPTTPTSCEQSGSAMWALASHPIFYDFSPTFLEFSTLAANPNLGHCRIVFNHWIGTILTTSWWAIDLGPAPAPAPSQLPPVMAFSLPLFHFFATFRGYSVAGEPPLARLPTQTPPSPHGWSIKPSPADHHRQDHCWQLPLLDALPVPRCPLCRTWQARILTVPPLALSCDGHWRPCQAHLPATLSTCPNLVHLPTNPTVMSMPMYVSDQLIESSKLVDPN